MQLSSVTIKFGLNLKCNLAIFYVRFSDEEFQAFLVFHNSLELNVYRWFRNPSLGD